MHTVWSVIRFRGTKLALVVSRYAQQHYRNCVNNKKQNSSGKKQQQSIAHTHWVKNNQRRWATHSRSRWKRGHVGWRGKRKRGRRGVHLESAHPLQKGWGPLCHTVTLMPPLHHPKGHLALHCTASNTNTHTHTPFVHLHKCRWTHSHLSPRCWQVTAAAAQTQIGTDMQTPRVRARGR